MAARLPRPRRLRWIHRRPAGSRGQRHPHHRGQSVRRARSCHQTSFPRPGTTYARLNIVELRRRTRTSSRNSKGRGRPSNRVAGSRAPESPRASLSQLLDGCAYPRRMADLEDRGSAFDGVRIGRLTTGALVDTGCHAVADLPADLDSAAVDRPSTATALVPRSAPYEPHLFVFHRRRSQSRRQERTGCRASRHPRWPRSR